MRSPFICDVRVGAVAVYREPKVTCFADLPNTLYYGRGVMIEESWGCCWYVPLHRVWLAHIVCFCANVWERFGFTVKCD